MVHRRGRPWYPRLQVRRRTCSCLRIHARVVAAKLACFVKGRCLYCWLAAGYAPCASRWLEEWIKCPLRLQSRLDDVERCHCQIQVVNAKPQAIMQAEKLPNLLVSEVTMAPETAAIALLRFDTDRVFLDDGPASFSTSISRAANAADPDGDAISVAPCPYKRLRADK